MMTRTNAWIFLLCMALGSTYATAQKTCSTEVVNDTCIIHVDRRYPINLPTLQMRRGAKVTVAVDSPLQFESLTLDPQLTQGLIGTDQTSGFLVAAAPSLKNLVASASFAAFHFESAPVNLNAVPPDQSTALQSISDSIKKLTADLATDTQRLTHDNDVGKTLGSQSVQVYQQLQEIASPLPRPVTLVNGQFQIVRPGGLSINALSVQWDPWNHYAAWREVLLHELDGEACNTLPESVCAQIPIVNVLGAAAYLKTEWTNQVGCDATDSTKACPLPAFPSASLQNEVDATQSLIADATNGNSSGNQAVTAALAGFSQNLRALQQSISNIAATVPASKAAAISAEIDVITKDLNQYAANIYLAAPQTPTSLGDVYDPIVDPNDTNRKIIASLSHSDVRKLGRQAVFAVNAVNLVTTSAASVPAAASKKALATITILYADPIFETSAGTFFSFIPNRTFSNQTNFTRNPDGTTTGCATNTTPVYCSVSIVEQDKRPTVIPFVGANWRLGHDFPWPGGRRGATYFTAALGINPNSATTEYAAGLSLSWRAIMFSPLFHLGKDIHLTQAETVGEIMCYYNPLATQDKCGSPSTPSPSTKQYWRGAFAIGLSVRIPSIFSANGH